MNNFRLRKCTIQTANGYLAWQGCIHTLRLIDLYTGFEDNSKGYPRNNFVCGWRGAGSNAFFQ